MRFQHSELIWRDYPELVPCALAADGISPDVTVEVEKYYAIAQSRLDGRTESELPEIQAWRRTFSRMGLKPTQYRCAAESLLRRFRKEGSLPGLHPLVDLCNAISLAYAIPVAVFDTAAIDGDLEVRYATGDEDYLTFSGEHEHPDLGEVIFADQAERAHARRWTNRQSGRLDRRYRLGERFLPVERVAVVPDEGHLARRRDPQHRIGIFFGQDDAVARKVGGQLLDEVS
jgi:DNA/RNA-binding domain of Phe-tRNA-synthetase-like protein